MNDKLAIKRVIPKDSIDALELIGELDNELLQRYPSSSINTLDLDKITNESGLFLVGYISEIAVACCSLCEIEPSVGEIKRVFVKPQYRRKRIAEDMMEYLEERAVECGFKILRVETGVKQPEAIAMYQKLGYYDIAKYGEYINDSNSICMEKRLTEKEVR
jgi:ribosomal protein S18 acetylase RimI-like enzyme